MNTSTNSTPTIPTFTMPALLLRVEGLVLFVAALMLYSASGGSWLLFAALLLVPDLSMTGYLRNPKFGALVYNLFHNLLAPALLALVGTWTGTALLTQIAIIWFAHISMDRVAGYGLKYVTAFKATHLQRI